MENKPFAYWKKWRSVQIAFCMFVSIIGAEQLHGQNTTATANAEKKTMTTQTRFYCNTKALNPAQRARHKQLTEKLIGTRREVVEMEKGYEFQYAPSDLSLSELAEWVVTESKCCPFFDFHIDVEREGSLFCLRLTGDEGIKPFVLAEFAVPTK